MGKWAFRFMYVWVFAFTTFIWVATFEQGVFNAGLWDLAAYVSRWTLVVGVPVGCLIAICRDYEKEAASMKSQNLRVLTELRSLLKKGVA